ncbi:MAG TPA: 2'-5' RNA ligase family protein, partial [Polyangiaceae bacterium]|nr:2'-5' RNA ligase family protein [Polyangiaceae bacterium]
VSRADKLPPGARMLRPNWFFAFPVDGAFLRELPELPGSLRRFHEEDVHLTLAFLGGVGEAAAERSLAALDERLASTPVPSIEVSLGEVVPMGGSRSRYTALSALLARGRPEATACITALRDVLTETANGRREQRAAKPHVTLARPRQRATDADRQAGLVWAAQLDLGGVHATLDRIALYTWSERRQARLFRIVAERRLAPAPSAPADPADRSPPGRAPEP